MATRNIVPRANDEGTIGTTLKNWLNGFFKYFTISTYIKFLSPSPVPAHEEGILFYDNLCGGLQLYNENSQLTWNIGGEVVLKVKNESGIEIPNGKIVKIVGEVLECVALVELAQADSGEHARGAFAMTTTTVPDDGYGYATALGQVHGLDTSLWVAGTKLYLSDTVAGGVTNTAPTISVPIGTVVHSDDTIGSIFININETVDQLGDMLKGIYDVNLNDIVDKAETLNDGSTGGGNNVTAQEARDHIDMAHYSSSDFDTDFASSDLADLGTKDHSSLTNKNLETDIKHVTDNQKDALDNANSPASANPFITEEDVKYYYAESLTETSTTNSYPTYDNKLTLSIPTPIAGDYILQWSCEISNANGGNDSWFRVRNGVTTFTESRLNITVSYANSGWEHRSGIVKVTLSSASDFYIDFCRSNGTAYIKNVRILLRRIA